MSFRYGTTLRTHITKIKKEHHMNSLSETIIKKFKKDPNELNIFVSLTATISEYQDDSHHYNDFMNMDSFDREAIASTIAAGLVAEFMPIIFSDFEIELLSELYIPELNAIKDTAVKALVRQESISTIRVVIVKQLTAISNEIERPITWQCM
jgi:hypothetical protein